MQIYQILNFGGSCAQVECSIGQAISRNVYMILRDVCRPIPKFCKIQAYNSGVPHFILARRDEIWRQIAYGIGTACASPVRPLQVG